MPAITLLNSALCDAIGAEVVPRIIGSREPPANMVLQISIDGAADVQIQGRITREAPWQNIGPPHSASTLVHINAVQFLRALASNVREGAKVSVWADWAW